MVNHNTVTSVVNKSNTTTQSKIFEKEVLGVDYGNGLDRPAGDQLPPTDVYQQKRLATR